MLLRAKNAATRFFLAHSRTSLYVVDACSVTYIESKFNSTGRKKPRPSVLLDSEPRLFAFVAEGRQEFRPDEVPGLTEEIPEDRVAAVLFPADLRILATYLDSIGVSHNLLAQALEVC